MTNGIPHFNKLKTDINDYPYKKNSRLAWIIFQYIAWVFT